MKLDIRLFTELHEIAKRHGITQVEWANRSGKPITQQRISELCAMEGGADVDRVFSLQKYASLIGGLMAILRATKFQTEWTKLTESEPDLTYKVAKQAIYVMLFGGDNDKSQLSSLLDLMIHKIR